MQHIAFLGLHFNGKFAKLTCRWFYIFLKGSVNELNRFENIEFFTNSQTASFDVSTLSAEDKIIYLAGVCGYISAEELALYAEFKLKDAEYRIRKLSGRGLLSSHSLGAAVGHTKTVYALTQRGAEQYALITNEYVELTSTVDKKLKRGGSLCQHDYLAGMNYIACLSVMPGCLWHSETVFGQYLRGGNSGAVCPDGVMYYGGIRYFFEEDLNTERNVVLTNKLAKYQKQGLLSDKQGGVIISLYSQRDRAVNAPLPEFNRTNIRAVIADMELRGLSSCYTYLLSLPKDSGHYNTVYALLHKVRVLKDGERVKNHDYSITKLKQYLYDLENLSNYYENAEGLNGQLKDLYLKRTALIKTLGLKYTSDAEISQLYNGFALYLFPTLSVGRYMDFVSHIREYILSSCLVEYDKECFTRSFYKTACEISCKKGTPVPVSLRNVFVSDARKIAVEYLSFDLGAWLRCMYFVSQRHLFEDNAILIMVIERVEDAIHFCEATRRYIFTHGFLDGQFYFIQRGELNKPRALFGVTGYNRIDSLTNKFTYQRQFFEDVEVVPDGVLPEDNQFGTTKDKIAYPFTNYEELF